MRTPKESSRLVEVCISEIRNDLSTLKRPRSYSKESRSVKDVEDRQKLKEEITIEIEKYNKQRLIYVTAACDKYGFNRDYIIKVMDIVPTKVEI